MKLQWRGQRKQKMGRRGDGLLVSLSACLLTPNFKTGGCHSAVS